jgi:acyl-CoA thioesterase
MTSLPTELSSIPGAVANFPIQEFFGFTIDRADRIATVALELGPRHLNPNGVAHGSVAFAIMDTAMGAAVMSVVPDGYICATVEMHTRFHSGAVTGQLRADAVVLTAGKRIVHVEAKAYGTGERLLASATASFAIIPQPAR